MTINISHLIAAGVLAVNAVRDIRKKEIILWLAVSSAAAGMVYGLVRGENVLILLAGMLPGGLMALLSAASRQAVGMGDAVILIPVGLWTGCRTAFLTLLAAFGVQVAVSVCYALGGGKKKSLPFVPALFAGYVLVLMLMNGSRSA